MLASDWSPGLQYKPLIGQRWPKNGWVLSLSAWVLLGPVSYFISEFLRLIITIVISVFQWQPKSSIENFFLSVPSLSLCWDSRRFRRLSPHYCQAEETHYGPNEPVCPCSRARNLTRCYHRSCGVQSGGGGTQAIGPIRRRGWRLDLATRPEKLCFLDGQ